MVDSLRNRVVIVASSNEEYAEIERALRDGGGPVNFRVSPVSTPLASSDFSTKEHTAIIFTRTSIEELSIESVALIRSLMESASCRVFLVEKGGSLSENYETQLDDLIQRTAINHLTQLAPLLADFFKEAESLWRTSNRLGIRDAVCIGAYRVLALLWPLSYLFSIALVIHAVTPLILNGPPPWQSIVAMPVVSATLIVFGTFFCFHALYTLIKNYLFVSRIVGAISLEFLLPATAFCLTSAAVIGSIWVLRKPVVWSLIALAVVIAVYSSYLYARRIRAECTSLSHLQTAMASSASRRQIAEMIGNEPMTPKAFSIFARPEPRSIFISYMHKSHWSAKTARQLDEEWKARGIRVFLDRSTIPSGTPWRQHLLRAISECANFIAILDHKTEESDWVLAESAYAALLRKNVGKPKILVVVRDRAGIKALRSGAFGLVYRDLFDIPPAMSYGARLFAGSEKHESQISAEMLEGLLGGIRPMSLLSDLGGSLLPKRLIIQRSLSKLLKSCETLERAPQGDAKHARDTLVKIGVAALPALMKKNEQLIASHQAYSEFLKSGRSPNPYDNYDRKSDAQRRYRYVIEIKQARVVDLIQDIQRASGFSA